MLKNKLNCNNLQETYKNKFTYRIIRKLTYYLNNLIKFPVLFPFCFILLKNYDQCG